APPPGPAPPGGSGGPGGPPPPRAAGGGGPFSTQNTPPAGTPPETEREAPPAPPAAPAAPPRAKTPDKPPNPQPPPVVAETPHPEQNRKPPERQQPAPLPPGTEARVLTRLNTSRREAGLAPVVLDADLARACRDEARQAAEGPGKLAPRQDREALLFVSDPLPALDGALATCFARLRFLDPALERFGVGWGQRPSGERVTAFRSAGAASSSGGGRRDAELIYPSDGQRDVPLSFPGNEVPDPIPQASRKVAGFPVTVTFPSGTSISDATGRLLGGDGREV